MASSPVVTLRLTEPVLNRLNEAVEKAGCSRSAWITEAVVWALEREEAPHVPKKVIAAIPRRAGARVIMPDGIQFRNL
jgi:metal-responsive CopG/Arc/MetJ family transcriptional regulator